MLEETTIESKILTQAYVEWDGESLQFPTETEAKLKRTGFDPSVVIRAFQRGIGPKELG